MALLFHITCGIYLLVFNYLKSLFIYIWLLCVFVLCLGFLLLQQQGLLSVAVHRLPVAATPPVAGPRLWSPQASVVVARGL